MLLTAQQILSFQRCHRQVYLDANGDPQDKAAPSDFLTKLRADRAQHQNDFLATFTWQKPHYPPQDWDTGTQATQTLMAQGVEQIHGGLMQIEVQPGLSLASRFDLLTKVDGPSHWGDWHYVPTSIQLGKRPKLEYKIMATFQAMILAAAQGTWPAAAYLYLRQRGWYTVNLEQHRPQLETLLADLTTLLDTQQEPEVFISSSRCNLCGWFQHCYTLAQAQQHLSLLPGVTVSRYPMLVRHQLTTVEALANIDPQALHTLTGLDLSVTEKLVNQALAQHHNQPILRALWPGNQAAVLPTAAIELYFDIEAEPSLNLAYLHGVLVVDHGKNEQTFHPLLAESPDQEQRVWCEFVALVQQYPTAPIFHFCDYEAQTVKRLAHLYQTPDTLVEPILARFIDIHEWITHTVTLPVENYTLKLIARWLGFHWRNAEANGAQSIYWYSQWLETGNPQFLDTIVHYNEDDCRATFHVKDWLSAYLSEQAVPYT